MPDSRLPQEAAVLFFTVAYPKKCCWLKPPVNLPRINTCNQHRAYEMEHTKRHLVVHGRTNAGTDGCTMHPHICLYTTRKAG